MKNITTSKTQIRKRRHARIRAKVQGTAERPRLAVHKSNRFVSVQLIDDVAQKTIAASHGREFKGPQSVQATSVGTAIAKKALAAGISKVVFDRGGYRYSGQVKTIADAARAEGLVF